MEACITHHGTVIGPLMTDLIGHPELTPYRGGWCGNDIHLGALSASNRESRPRLHAPARRPAREGGLSRTLEVDYLVDAGSGDLYLGEINPRLSGISSMTNVSASAYADMPLFLFHLAEYLDLDYEIDIEDLRRRWASDHLADVWARSSSRSSATGSSSCSRRHRPGSGGCRRTAGCRFVRAGLDWHSLGDESEAFWLRILGTGRLPLPRRRSRDARQPGADAERRRQPRDCAQASIRAIRDRFVGSEPQHEPPPADYGVLAFKAG